MHGGAGALPPHAFWGEGVQAQGRAGTGIEGQVL